MREAGRSGTVLGDTKIDVKIKLAALWTAVMFLYLYVDIINFFKPGVIEDILVGKVWEFEISQAWAMGAIALMTVPSLMVFLSLALPARVNRVVSIAVAALYIPVSAGNVLGETWAFYFWGAAVEVVLLSLVIWFAWKWPRIAPRGATLPA